MTDTLIQAMESQRRRAVDLILKNGDLDFAYLEAVAAGEAAMLVIDMPPPGALRRVVFRRWVGSWPRSRRSARRWST